jgi:elongation factor G
MAVVCEADEKKPPQLQIILRELEELGIPRFLFLNKIDRANKRIRETLATLQPASRVPLVLRQIPIWNGDLIEGFVDLALERAFVYREHKPSEVIGLEGGNLDREKEARFSMLEKLADHDDADGALLKISSRRACRSTICPRTSRRTDLSGAAGSAVRERRAAVDEGAAA